MSSAQIPAYSGHVDPQGAPATRRLADITITKLSVGPMDNNAYLLVCLETGDALLIDAANDSERIADLLGDGPDRPRLRSIVTTHSHGDHWQALGRDRRPDRSQSLRGGRRRRPTCRSRPMCRLGQGDVVPLGSCQLESIALRGHTPGSVALLYQDPSGTAHLFTGDSLFPGGPGRTQSPQSFASLMDDLTDRVFDRLPGRHLDLPRTRRRHHARAGAARTWPSGATRGW